MGNAEKTRAVFLGERTLKSNRIAQDRWRSVRSATLTWTSSSMVAFLRSCGRRKTTLLCPQPAPLPKKTTFTLSLVRQKLNSFAEWTSACSPCQYGFKAWHHASGWLLLGFDFPRWCGWGSRRRNCLTWDRMCILTVKWNPDVLWVMSQAKAGGGCLPPC